MIRMFNTDRWNDKELQRLDPVAQLLENYFNFNGLTHISGLYLLPFGRIVAQFPQIPNRNIVRFTKLLHNSGRVFYDFTQSLVFLPNFFAEQSLKPNRNVDLSVRRQLDAIGNHRFVAQFLELYPRFGEQAPAEAPASSPLGNKAESGKRKAESEQSVADAIPLGVLALKMIGFSPMEAVKILARQTALRGEGPALVYCKALAEYAKDKATGSKTGYFLRLEGDNWEPPPPTARKLTTLDAGDMAVRDQLAARIAPPMEADPVPIAGVLAKQAAEMLKQKEGKK